MEVSRLLTGEAIQAVSGTRADRGTQGSGEVIATAGDRVQLGGSLRPDELDTLARMGRARSGSTQAPSAISLMTLIEPNPNVPPARNDTPVVVVHGTMADAKRIPICSLTSTPDTPSTWTRTARSRRASPSRCPGNWCRATSTTAASR